jgi:hypothetical protein
MKTIKRIWNNIKWLLNRPPTGITSGPGDLSCDYCGRINLDGKNPLWGVEGIYCICESCRKKVFDSILKPNNSEKE